MSACPGKKSLKTLIDKGFDCNCDLNWCYHYGNHNYLLLNLKTKSITTPSAILSSANDAQNECIQTVTYQNRVFTWNKPRWSSNNLLVKSGGRLNYYWTNLGIKFIWVCLDRCAVLPQQSEPQPTRMTIFQWQAFLQNQSCVKLQHPFTNKFYLCISFMGLM